MVAASDLELEAAVASESIVRARVLGGFEVVVRGRSLTRSDWRGGSARRLVKLLLVTPGHQLQREVAAETLWPEGRPDRSLANLRKAIHFARRALGVDGPLVDTNGSIGLDPARIEVDVDSLEAAIAIMSHHALVSRAGESTTVDRAAAEVLRLGRLDLLPDDPYEDWLALPRARLRAGWERVALAVARATSRAGRREDAHQLVDELLARDPADEAAHRLAIELYAEEGRHHAAREQVAQCEAALREIDAEPSEETLAAFALAWWGLPRAER